ncbi:sulfite exporter TauE/SafE family protein [Parasulfuritortus cantonensis]|uniref:Probable membrane transporter protein n=1 Tax=Parasulfuritortus cantonensis TaxID=2528202 RepID=A0A4R1BJ16_9PROT|nr:sulfite exporter TauE/SafE family protein [Parasulfuritortus cantonensis]TCJ17207.1 sulfite exporter TauE/SafE family protein [Parasulfuritortus cantonensis]
MLDIASFLALGLVAGLLAGMLGIGGGVVIVPALIWIFQAEGMSGEIVPHLAIGTSLATIVFTSLSAIRAQQKRGAIDWSVVRLLAPATLLGGFASGYLAGYVPAATLKGLFATFLLFVGTQFILDWKPAAHWRLPGRAGLWSTGLGIGALSALLGIGGGNITVPFLHACNMELKRAIAISTALGFPIALFGAAGFLVTGLGNATLPAGSVGYVSLPALAAVAAVSMLTAPAGVRLSHALPVKKLKRIFGVLVLLISLRMLWNVLM